MGKVIIDINQSVTSRLPFEPLKEYDNFCVANLVDVRVEDVESKEDAKWEFKGMSFKRLVFEFKQKVDNFNDKDRYLTMSLMPVQHYKENASVLREADKIVKSYQELWKHVKHIHDQFAGVEGYRPITEAPEFDDEADIDTRIAQFGTFAEKIVKSFNDVNGNPFYKTLDITLKAIASGPKMSYYALPEYVGRGYAEPTVMKNGKLNTSLKFAPNETTILGAVAVQNVPANPVQEGISQDIMAMINARK